MRRPLGVMNERPDCTVHVDDGWLHLRPRPEMSTLPTRDVAFVKVRSGPLAGTSANMHRSRSMRFDEGRAMMLSHSASPKTEGFPGLTNGVSAIHGMPRLEHILAISAARTASKVPIRTSSFCLADRPGSP